MELFLFSFPDRVEQEMGKVEACLTEEVDITIQSCDISLILYDNHRGGLGTHLHLDPFKYLSPSCNDVSLGERTSIYTQTLVT